MTKNKIKFAASTTVQNRIAASVENVFDQTLPVDLSVIFKRYGLMPAVIKQISKQPNQPYL